MPSGCSNLDLPATEAAALAAATAALLQDLGQPGDDVQLRRVLNLVRPQCSTMRRMLAAP